MKQFALGTVLSITQDRLLCDFGEVYSILNYMTGDSLFTHQLPRAMRECRPWLLRQHPQLADVDTSTVNRENWKEQLAAFETIHGAALAVSPIPADDHARKDPVAELVEMVGEDRVIAISPE